MVDKLDITGCMFYKETSYKILWDGKGYYLRTERGGHRIDSVTRYPNRTQLVTLIRKWINNRKEQP